MPLRREPNWQTTMSRMISAASCFERQPYSDTWVLSLLTCREESSMRLTTWAVSWFANVPKWWLRNEFLAGSMAHNSECSIDSRRRKFCFVGISSSEENGSSFSCVWEMKWDMFELKTREMIWNDWLTQNFVVCCQKSGMAGSFENLNFQFMSVANIDWNHCILKLKHGGTQPQPKIVCHIFGELLSNTHCKKILPPEISPIFGDFFAALLKCTQEQSKIGGENFLPITHCVVTPNASLLRANRAARMHHFSMQIEPQQSKLGKSRWSRDMFWLKMVLSCRSWHKQFLLEDDGGKNRTENDFHFIRQFHDMFKKKLHTKQFLEVTAAHTAFQKCSRKWQPKRSRSSR